MDYITITLHLLILTPTAWSLSPALFHDAPMFRCENNRVFHMYSPAVSLISNGGRDVADCSLQLTQSVSGTLHLSLTYIQLHPSHNNNCTSEYLQIHNERLCDTTEKIVLNPSVNLTIKFHSSLSSSSVFYLQLAVLHDFCDPALSFDDVELPALFSTDSRDVSRRRCAVKLNSTGFKQLEVTQLLPAGRCKTADRVTVLGQSVCISENCKTKIEADRRLRESATLHYSLDETCPASRLYMIKGVSENITNDICSLPSILTDSTGNISSSNYPQPYYPASQCTVTVQGYSFVHVAVLYYDLPVFGELSSCNGNDRLVIGGESLCGRRVDKVDKYLTNKNNDITFITSQDSRARNYQGFTLQYTGYQEGWDICSQNRLDFRNSDEIFINSPNFPSNYSNNRTCEIRLATEGITELTVCFIRFKLEEGNEGGDQEPRRRCPFDYLSIRGNRYCENSHQGSVIKLPVNRATEIPFTFRSDETSSESGFYLKIAKIKPERKQKIPINRLPDAFTIDLSDMIKQIVNTSYPLVIASNQSSTAPRTTFIPTSRSAKSATQLITYHDKKIARTTAETPRMINTHSQTTTVLTPTKDISVISYEQTTTVNSRRTTTEKQKTHSKTTFHQTYTPKTETVQNGAKSDKLELRVTIPWYYWLGSIIALTIAVLITALCFIIIRRLETRSKKCEV